MQTQAHARPIRHFQPSLPEEGAYVVKTLESPDKYDDREGFDPKFLGVSTPLPHLGRLVTDAVKLEHGRGVELKYANFSTIQSRSRRLPFFSACNIDGAQREKEPRSNRWRFDPRISTEHQILEECYGSEDRGLFSRGHMTRREDPVWGARAEVAEEDTFLATNCVPQMQSHNGGLWLSLENYVLDNASEDRQRACVITGPVLSHEDPVLYGVKIPVRLWKIIAFIHDETHALAAVAYCSSQAGYLPDAFVWGQFRCLQVPVSRIADETGLDFGPLRAADVMAQADPSCTLLITKEEDLLLAG
ncbi:DNA/RNA non-specific endonuclease [Minicystis rosea]|nr:DNA/RNA non-specific endonuclease [Minicystis rosea]